MRRLRCRPRACQSNWSESLEAVPQLRRPLRSSASCSSTPLYMPQFANGRARQPAMADRAAPNRAADPGAAAGNGLVVPTGRTCCVVAREAPPPARDGPRITAARTSPSRARTPGRGSWSLNFRPHRALSLSHNEELHEMRLNHALGAPFLPLASEHRLTRAPAGSTAAPPVRRPCRSAATANAMSAV
jgi:hypothetical protein